MSPARSPIVMRTLPSPASLGSPSPRVSVQVDIALTIPVSRSAVVRVEALSVISAGVEAVACQRQCGAAGGRQRGGNRGALEHDTERVFLVADRRAHGGIFSPAA